MRDHRKTTWIARCIKRLVKLQPDLIPGVAARSAARAWRDERVHVPAVRPPHRLFNHVNRVLERLLHTMLGDWWVDLMLMLFIVSMILSHHYS
jgi:hypothetical protein